MVHGPNLTLNAAYLRLLRVAFCWYASYTNSDGPVSLMVPSCMVGPSSETHRHDFKPSVNVAASATAAEAVDNR